MKEMSDEDIAERIITFQGVGFALASLAGNRSDIREARKMLKDAIVVVLAEKEAVVKWAKPHTD